MNQIIREINAKHTGSDKAIFNFQVDHDVKRVRSGCFGGNFSPKRVAAEDVDEWHEHSLPEVCQKVRRE
jgi:hypothetical protein